MQVAESGAAAPLVHADAVVRLNQLVAAVYTARAQCHERLRRALSAAAPDNPLDAVLGAVDAYGAALEDLYNDIIALKLRYPAAWAESDSGRQRGACQAAMEQMATDALAALAGFGWPDADPDPDPASGSPSRRV